MIKQALRFFILLSILVGFSAALNGANFFSVVWEFWKGLVNV